MCTVKARAWERARRGRLASSPTTSCTREAAGKPEQVLDTHWCVFLNLPSGLGSSDERAVWATSDNQLSAEAAEELEPRKGRRHASPCNLGAQAVRQQRPSRARGNGSAASVCRPSGNASPPAQLRWAAKAKHPSPRQRGKARLSPRPRSKAARRSTAHHH